MTSKSNKINCNNSRFTKPPSPPAIFLTCREIENPDEVGHHHTLPVKCKRVDLRHPITADLLSATLQNSKQATLDCQQFSTLAALCCCEQACQCSNSVFNVNSIKVVLCWDLLSDPEISRPIRRDHAFSDWGR